MRLLPKLNALKPGDAFSMDRLSSFSEDPKFSAKFAMTPRAISTGVIEGAGDMHPDDAEGYFNYEIQLVGPKKSANIAAMSKYPGEREHLTFGNYEVVSVEDNVSVSVSGSFTVPYRRRIVLRQKGIY